MISRGIPLLIFTAALSAQDNGVKVREDRITLSTYDEAAPDPNPQFGAFYGEVFPNYPYTIRTLVNKVGHPAQWRVLVLENEYLSCRILPDLGGHLHGCTDRITGREIFYSNPAVRRGDENPRNNFIATGIESSFPVAHSRVASSPVDYAWSLRDGVGTVIVEDTDRTTGMQWRDEFILRPGSAVLEQRVTLYNGSGARRGYQWWVNAAIELNDPHLRIVYPVKWMLPHGDGPMTSWPVDAKGKDLSDIANHKDALGLFGHGSREPWMAIYKPAFRSGVVHYADAEQIEGKKIWLWGKDDAYVKENLTEKFNSYVEMQAGLFETQPEFSFLLPEESKTFTHFWIPFHNLGGIVRATADIVLNLSRSGAGAVLELEATHAIAGAKLRLSDGPKIVSETQVNLNPRAGYSRTLEDAPAKLTVDVIGSDGRSLLHHVEGEYDSLPFDKAAPNPEPVPPADKSDSVAAVLERGAYNEQRDLWAFAWRDYESGLKKSPGDPKLLLAAGRAAVVLYRYDDAIRMLSGIAGNSAEAAYYYGMALGNASRNVPEARAALARAATDPVYATAARLQLALLDARELQGPRTVEAARNLAALADAPGAPVRLGALEVALWRHAGDVVQARKRLEFWLRQDPASNMLRVEGSFPGNPDDPSLWEHFAGDPERVLDVADQYLQIGAYDDALKILDRRYVPVPATETEPGTVLPQENALLVYYRGYCRLKTGGDPKPDFLAASRLSTLYLFPHRATEFEVFEAVLARNDADASAHAFLGDLYFDSLQTDKAIAEWEKALALNRDLPALHRNLGRALLDVGNDPAAAAPVLLEGRRLAPEDRETAQALNRLNTVMSVAPKLAPLSPAETAGAPETAAPPNALAEKFGVIELTQKDLVSRALVLSAVDPDKAAAVFNAANFPRGKQPPEVRRAYIEVQLQRLLAQARQGHCGEAALALETLGDEDAALPFTLYGFGAFLKSPHFQYFMGIVENDCGAAAGAKKRWSKLSRSTEPVDSIDYAFPLLAAKKLGESDAAPKIDAALQALKAAPGSSSPALSFSQGALLMAAGKSGDAGVLLRKSMHAADAFVQFISLEVLLEFSRK